ACSARTGAAWPASATRGVTPIAPTNSTTRIRRLTNFCTVAFISPHTDKKTVLGFCVLRPRFWVLRPRFWVLQPRFWVLQPRFWGLQPRFWGLHPRFWGLGP